MSESASVLLCTAGYDHTVTFWDAIQGFPERHINFTNSQVNALCISVDKSYLAVAGHQIVKLFTITDSQVSSSPILTLKEHTGNVTAVGFHKVNKWMFTASEDGSCRIWDIRSPKGKCQRVRTLKNKPTINTAILHPNQGEIFLGDQCGFIHVWDLTANKCSVWHQPDGRTPIRSIAIASDAKYLVAGTDRGTFHVYNKYDEDAPNEDGVMVGPKWQTCMKVNAHTTYILKVLFSPDCRYLSTASADNTIKLFDVDDGFTQYRTLKGHHRWVWDISFSADSQYLVSASSDKTAKLWDIKRGKDILSYKVHTKAVTCVVLNDYPT